MTLEQLEREVKDLREAFIQSQKNQVSITGKVDDTSNRVTQITPYTETQTAYYGETEKTFYNVPQGNVTVYGLSQYSMSRISDRLVFTFEPLTEQTDITISIL